MGTRSRNRGLLCASLLLAASVASSAQAQSSAADSDRANVLFKKGKVAYNAGKYADALRIYTEAWQLKQSADIAANLAQAEAELGKHRDAAEHYSFALAHLLPSTTDDQKKALADGLETEKKEIGSLHVTLEPTDAALTIDEQPVSLPPGGDLFVEPGEHRAAVTHEGYTANAQTVRVSKGAAQVLWIKLRSADAPAPGTGSVPPTEKSVVIAPPPDLSEPPSRSIVPALVGGGVFVAGAALGVVFLLSGNSSQNDADALSAKLTTPNACGAGTPNAAECAALHDKNSDIDRARTIETVGFAVAGAAAVGTAVYLLWPHSNSPAANHWAPTLAVAPGAGSIGLAGRF